MRQLLRRPKMDWDDYYDRFYDLAESTQINRLSSLTSFGPSEEICEIAQAFTDDKAVTRLIRKALGAGVKFSVAEIKELLDLVADEIYDDLVKSNSNPYTADDLDYLYGYVDDTTIQFLSKKDHVNLTMPYECEPEPAEQKGLGFWGTLILALGASSHLNRTRQKSGEKCNGDCASCPPHYGYRYDRWYYGHNHDYGCEFGGNKK